MRLTSVAQHIKSKRNNKRYREAEERLRPYEQLARLVIMRRGRLGLSQQELADRITVPISVIARIESGQHPTPSETVDRLVKALEEA